MASFHPSVTARRSRVKGSKRPKAVACAVEPHRVIVSLYLPSKGRPLRRALTFLETRPLGAVIADCCPNADLSQHKSLQTGSSVFLRLVITSRTAALDVLRTSTRAAWQLCEAYSTPHSVIAGSAKSQGRHAFPPSRSAASMVFCINYILLFHFPDSQPKVASKERQVSRREEKMKRFLLAGA
jgi:hypothetical protein